MNTERKTAEGILKEHVQCICSPAYKDRNLTDPDCCLCNEYEPILAAMEAYKNQPQEQGEGKVTREQIIEAIITAEHQYRDDKDSPVRSYYTYQADAILKLFGSHQSQEWVGGLEIENAVLYGMGVVCGKFGVMISREERERDAADYLKSLIAKRPSPTNQKGE